MLLLGWFATLLWSSSATGQNTNDVLPTTAIAGNYTGQYRPQVHYSPPEGFMNDPNGMFQDANGTYHLYYQYNPTDTIAGNQHWGHATSLDLYHWTNQAIALAPYDNVTGIFSGSAIIDINNTSGFFPNQTNGVVAIYTANGPDDQNQAIAYSHDDGYTFTIYDRNPVLAIGSTQFRDPKVIWHAPTHSWVMVVAFAHEFAIGIYTSPNLREWSFASNFSQAGFLGLQYECPNLVEVPLYVSSDGDSDSDANSTWLMYISINPGAPLGGSIGTYFSGSFNGTHFLPHDHVARLADFGKDNYAAQFFWHVDDDERARDGRDAVSVAWASNWQYTNHVPTGPAEGWQSAMSLPRRNFVAREAGVLRDRWVLGSWPVGLEGIRGRELASRVRVRMGDNVTAVAGGAGSGNAGAEGTFLLSVNITGLNLTGISNVASVNVTFSSTVTGETLAAGQLFGGDPSFWMDRGAVRGFENVFFTDKVSAAFALRDSWECLMVLDRSVWEVFLMGGLKSATQTYFAEGVLDRVVVQVQGLNEGAVVDVGVWELKSAWADQAGEDGLVRGNTTEVSGQMVKRAGAGASGDFWS
jgi:beta-fructofuranosidase